MTLDDNDNPAEVVREPIGADFIIPLLACALAIYYLATTTDLVWEARAAGVFVGVPLIAMCVVHMGRMVFRIATGRASLGTGDLFANSFYNRQRLALLVLGILFIAAIQLTGTTLGIFLFLIASMLVLGVRSIPMLAGISIFTSGLVFVLLIVLLGSRLPRGPIETLLLPLFGGG